MWPLPIVHKSCYIVNRRTQYIKSTLLYYKEHDPLNICFVLYIDYGGNILRHNVKLSNCSTILILATNIVSILSIIHLFWKSTTTKDNIWLEGVNKLINLSGATYKGWYRSSSWITNNLDLLEWSYKLIGFC
jgi:hypothetical protein